MMAGIAGGAEFVVIPEVDIDPEEIAKGLAMAYDRGKQHAIVVVAEGARYNAAKLDEYFLTHRDRLGFDLRMTILGHVQRGGSPGAFDRILASRLGYGAVEALHRGESGVLVGQIRNEVKTTPLDVVANNKKSLDMKLLELARVLD